VINEEEFMDIRALHRQGLTYAEIGRLVGRDWRTVKRYLVEGAQPVYRPTNELLTIEQAAKELSVSGPTIYRWLRAGLLPGEQTTPGAPWRIRLSDEIRRRFVADVPDGFVPLAEAAKALGVARQTVLHKVQRGELEAIQVTTGRRKGLRIQVPADEAGLFDQ